MKFSKGLFLLVSIVALIFISCEKENLSTPTFSEQNLELESQVKSESKGPLITYTLNNICAKRKKVCDFNLVPYYFQQNSVTVRLDYATYNYYQALRYRIFTTGGGLSLVFDCTSAVNSQDVILTPTGGLNNNTQYSVVVSNPNGTGAVSQLIVAGDCEPVD